MPYTIERRESNDRLLDSSGGVVYEWDGGYNWPDPDAIDAMVDDAGIGEPQKSFFKTLFLGPAVDDSSVTE